VGLGAGVVILHAPDAAAVQGVTRYSNDLAAALADAGEPVRRLRLKPWELRLGKRRVGGFVSMRLQGAFRPWPKRDVLHSTFHVVAHPRCDVATVHDLFPQTHAGLLGISPTEARALDRGLAKLAARKVHLACVSSAVRDAVAARVRVPDERLHAIPSGVSGRFQPAAPDAPLHPAYADRDAVHVLCVADLNPRKPFDQLLEAAARVGDPRLRIVHAGPARVRRPAWAAQREREAAWEAKLGGRVRRLGAVGDDELLRLYQGADLFVLPTVDEGFGFPPLEALACGTPVAVSDIPVFRETLGDQARRFADADGLARVLEAALRAPRPAAAQRQAAHGWVRQRFSWRRTAEAFRGLYGEARGRRV
jgi:glycosyltransferase involved in cell wall biosynthesis